MTVSAETFFHFTNSLDNLRSIFESGFWLRYSIENYEGIMDKVLASNRNSNDSEKEILIPMICFCDLPVMQLNEHIRFYGSYAIGLSKDWGFENKLSPVIYAHPNSYTTEMLNHVHNKLGLFFDIDEELAKEDSKYKQYIEQQVKVFKSIEAMDGLSEVITDVSNLIKFIKPYSGVFRDKGNKKFYDEKEWRFVPIKKDLDKIGLKDSYSSSFYYDLRKRRYLRIQTHNKFTLEFKPSDIKFIILKTESEVPEFIKFIKELYYNKYTQKEIDILTTRVLTLEHIDNDF